MGADTRQAKAEDRVAPKIPAVMRGAKAETILMVWTQKHGCMLLLCKLDIQYTADKSVTPKDNLII